MSTATKQNSLLSLDAAQASITTATVTIRTLRVNNKQLTQSTFKQLPERDLLDEDIPKILGTIWGWVNYLSNPGRNHKQFVVQFGEELCRCEFTVRKVRPGEGCGYSHGPEVIVRGCVELQEKLCYHHALAWKEFYLRVLAEDEQVKNHKWYNDGPRSFLIAGTQVFGGVAINPDSEVTGAMKNYLSPTPGTSWRTGEAVKYTADECKAENKAKLLHLMAKDSNIQGWSLPGTVEEVREDMLSNTSDAIAYAQRWNELMDRLGTVPQLFIAC